MISKDDPLKSLYVDKSDVDRLRLFLALKRYLAIDKSSGAPVYLEDFFELEKKEKIIIYLLYRRAISALGHIKRDDIGIGIRDLSNVLRMEYDEVRELLQEIESVECYKKRGRYQIPSDNLETAIKELKHEDDVYYSTDKYTKRIK